jgi:restriction endonuclease S subunit
VDFSHEYVIWGIDDAVFDFAVLPKGQKFEITDHCGAIRILDKNILANFLLVVLRKQKHELGFGWGYRASLSNMKQVVVEIPSKTDGAFDVNNQVDVVRRDAIVRRLRNELQSQAEELATTEVEISIDSPYRTVKLSEVFNFPETNSCMTRKLCRENLGTVPVYGCSKSENSVLGYIKENLEGVKYYQDSLTWNRNGSVGHFFYRQGIFTTNEDQRVIEIKPNYRHQLNPIFLKYVLENEVRKLGYCWTNKLGKAKMFDVEIRIPVDKNDKFDLTQQVEIARKYEKVYQVRDNVTQQLQSIAKVVVSI